MKHTLKVHRISLHWLWIQKSLIIEEVTVADTSLWSCPSHVEALTAQNLSTHGLTLLDGECFLVYEYSSVPG